MAQEKPYNLEPHIEAALSYIPFVGIAILLMEKDNKFVRFHAFQSVFFWIAGFALNSMVSSIFLIKYLLIHLVNIGIACLWFYLTWKAYNKIRFELPFIGKLAKEQAEK